MTRILSGVALAAAAVAAIWFLTPIALLVVALVVAAMAFTEYARIVGAIGADVPWWTTLLSPVRTCTPLIHLPSGSPKGTTKLR